MALYSLLRRASSSVLPVAIRSVGSQRSFHAVASLRSGNLGREIARRSFFPSAMRFSSAKNTADKNLLSVLENEIKCGEEVEGQDTVEDIPKDFPFEIEDNPGERTVFLTRKFRDETIEIEADIPNLSIEHEDGADVDAADVDADVATQESTDDSSIPLVVTICKANGLKLEFGITAFRGEFTIDSLSIKDSKASEENLAYEGPEFNDLDENFQKAFYSYLKVRGIDSETTSFLHEYMVSKEGKEYMKWLNDLKKFVEY